MQIEVRCRLDMDMCVPVVVPCTFLWLGGSAPISAAPGGPLQQLTEVMLEDGRVELLALAAKHAAGRLGAVKAHKLPPAHWVGHHKEEERGYAQRRQNQFIGVGRHSKEDSQESYRCLKLPLARSGQ